MMRLQPMFRLCSAIVLTLSVSVPASTAVAATQSPKMPVVPRWMRFEQEFRSSVAYSNAFQDVTMAVVFASPRGEKMQVYAFWDGGKIWRVRFSPREAGRWTYRTACSDQANEGLHNRAGEFICSTALGPNRFHEHGPVRVARDRRHLEHDDHTPFFWLGDAVWDGARVSEPSGWAIYARTRSLQKFTVTLWAAAGGSDARGLEAATGFADRAGINPEYFQRLDEKLERLSQSGILSAIVPYLERDSQRLLLPDHQLTLFVRYMVARWGAEPVVWVLPFDSETTGERIARWKKTGRAVFAEGDHAPVMVFAGHSAAVLDEFRAENWVDLFGYRSMAEKSEDSLMWSVAGPFSKEWAKDKVRPLIPFTPCENGLIGTSGKRFSSADVRVAAYRSLLTTVPAGITYMGDGVANWDPRILPQPGETVAANLPVWEKALFMPATKDLGHLADFVNTIEFWRLRPQQDLVAVQPGSESPSRYIVGACTAEKDLAVAYVPEDRSVDIAIGWMPPSPGIVWVNPRTGQATPAVAVVGNRTCQFPAPESGDWLLVMRGVR